MKIIRVDILHYLTNYKKEIYKLSKLLFGDDYLYYITDIYDNVNEIVFNYEFDKTTLPLLEGFKEDLANKLITELYIKSNKEKAT
jgi:hypothetical protein